jgi:outer membrane protein
MSITTGAKTTLVAVSMACVLAGCATVKRARAVQRGEGPVPGERTVTAAELGLQTNRVLSLDEAVRLALVHHPAVAAAGQSVVAASNQTRQVAAAFLPTVTGSAGYSQFTSETKASPDNVGQKALAGLVKSARDSGGVTPQAVQSWAAASAQPGKSHSYEAYSAGLSGDLLLYDFGRTPAALRQAVANQAAASEQLRLARNEVAYGVRAAFFNLAKAQALLGVAEESERQYRTHLQQVQAFFDVGRRIRYDLTKAEVDVRNAELAVINARNAVSNARAQLNSSLGLAEDPPYTVEGGTLAVGSLDRVAMLAVARERHPELGSLRAQERRASAAVDLAIADLYPEFRLKAGYSGKDAALPLIYNWSAALQGAMTLFSGGSRRARINETVANLRAARTQLAEREQRLFQVLSVACNQLEGATRRLAVTALLVNVASESLTLIEERYRVGSASAVEVTDAQVALTQSRADEVQARFDREAAVAAIRYAMGDEW